jgi:hypothetical protein
MSIAGKTKGKQSPAKGVPVPVKHRSAEYKAVPEGGPKLKSNMQSPKSGKVPSQKPTRAAPGMKAK